MAPVFCIATIACSVLPACRFPHLASNILSTKLCRVIPHHAVPLGADTRKAIDIFSVEVASLRFATLRSRENFSPQLDIVSAC